MDVPEWLKYVLALLSLGGGIWVLFERAETVIKPNVREDISRWLRNLDPGGSLRNWPDAFGKVFDSVFGERHLSWKCFVRSAITSIISVAIMTVLFIILTTQASLPDLEGYLFIVMSGVIFNVIPDYVSLLETRVVLQLMKRSSTIGRAVLVIADLLLTFAIFFAALFILISIFDGPLDGFEQAMEGMIGGIFFWQLSDSDFVGIFLYTTLLTSIWLWLYVGGGVALKVLQKTVGVRRWLDVEKAPLRAIGFVCNIALAFVLGVSFVVQLVAG